MPASRTHLLYWIPPVVWMTLIFIGSSDVLSGAHTSRFVVPFLRWLWGDAFTLERAAGVHFLIRKAGHFTEYAILAILFWHAVRNLPAYRLARPDRAAEGTFLYLKAVGLAALYAVSDEIHQLFIPTRTASPFDVMVDTMGAALGLLAYSGLYGWLTRRRRTPP